MHRHEFSELVIVSRGEALHLTDSDEQLILMGDAFILDPPNAHAYENVHDLELINILFRRDLLDAAGGGYTGSPKISVRLDTNQLTEVNTMVRELEEAAALGEPGALWLVTASFLKIVGTLLRWQSDIQSMSSKLDYQAAKAFAYIADHYAGRVSLSDLTGAAGMSESSLTRAFRKLAGLTPIEYVISYRIRQSCRLLQYTDKSVTEIAFACGFADSNYFSRKFHDLMETTPVGYRRHSRERTPPFDSELPQPSQSNLVAGREPE